MNKTINLQHLEERARQHLSRSISTSSSHHQYESSDEIDEELSLYQIELELQNADLIEAEIARSYTNSRYQTLFNLSPLAYFSLDTQGIITEVNQAGMQIFAREQHELVNKCFSRLVAPEFVMHFSGFFKEICEHNKISSCELKLLSGYSISPFYELNGIATVTNNGKVEVLLALIDISKYKILKNESTQQVQKKCSRYEFNNVNMAKIAHELNNPLTVVLNYVNGCINKIEANNCTIRELLHPLKEASRQSIRASELIQRLKNHQQYNDFDFKNENIDHLIGSIVDLIKNENPQFSLNVFIRQSPIPNVDLDKYLVEQVLINIFRNALEALQDSDSKDASIIVETNRCGKDFISVSIHDNGPGIAQESIDKIFQLYYTTKSYGLGLGLPLSLSIVKAHGGNMSVQTNTSGTTLMFTLKINQN